MDEKEAFAAAVRILSPAEARAIRARFHETFLDTASDFYRDRKIGTFVYHPSGKGNQHGCMWDCLRAYRRATWDEIRAAIADSREVLVMWDIMNLNPYTPPEVAHPFGPDAVIACRPAILEIGLGLLPDDLYIFDRTFEWAGVLTHEPWAEGVEPHKYLVLARDRLHSLNSTGEHWDFVQIDRTAKTTDSSLEIWLDDHHFADLIEPHAGDSVSIHFFPPREGWNWQVPANQLQSAITRALEKIGASRDSNGDEHRSGVEERKT